MFLSFSSHKYTILKYIGWHHIASYMPISNMDVGGASPILRKDFVFRINISGPEVHTKIHRAASGRRKNGDSHGEGLVVSSI